MGCTGSKQLGRGRWFGGFGRSKSLPVHLASGGRQRSGDGHHVVTLTSSSFGTLMLDRGDNSSDDEATVKVSADLQAAVSMAAIKAGSAREIALCPETWSEMIERRIPKTPTVTPPNEPEVINAWELMAGLEDASRLLLLPPAVHHGSFSFFTTRDAHFSSPDSEFTSSYSPKLELMGLSHDDSVFSGFDPVILSVFREAVNESHSAPPPPKPYKKEEEEEEKDEEDKKQPSLSIVRARINEFQQKIDAKKATRNPNFAKLAPSCKRRRPGGEGKVVLYFTSLRGIRKTYEDCRAMDTILKGYGVRVDERDVSMHAGFKEELIGTLGPGYRLPRVFADGRYLGGSDEVRKLHEEGRLAKLLERCEMAPQPQGKGDSGDAGCEGCGDLRFLPCETCSGSCKVYLDEHQEEGVELGGGFRRCSECNENGLVRCLFCR